MILVVGAAAQGARNGLICSQPFTAAQCRTGLADGRVRFTGTGECCGGSRHAEQWMVIVPWRPAASDKPMRLGGGLGRAGCRPGVR